VDNVLLLTKVFRVWIIILEVLHSIKLKGRDLWSSKLNV